MNKRIRALAGQAREFATTRHPVSNIVLSVNSDKFEEKFAELLLQECLTICDEVQCQYGQYTFTATTVKDRVIQHFGVES